MFSLPSSSLEDRVMAMQAHQHPSYIERQPLADSEAAVLRKLRGLLDCLIEHKSKALVAGPG